MEDLELGQSVSCKVRCRQKRNALIAEKEMLLAQTITEQPFQGYLRSYQQTGHYRIEQSSIQSNP